MENQEMSGIVMELVENALDMHISDVVEVHTEADISTLVEKGEKHGSQLIWINCAQIQDPLYEFWRLVKAEIFCDLSYVIFTDINSEEITEHRIPRWGDFKDYRGVLFGRVYLLIFDSVTSPGSKPSQKKIFQIGE